MRRLLALAASVALSGAADLDRARLEADAVPLLQALVRLDTSNPPGNETLAAKAIAGWLARDGIPSEIVGPSPDRGSVVARLEGEGTEPPLMLLSHLDVVPVEPASWSHDPFGGEIVGGTLYGRGTLDTKGLTVMQYLAFRDLERRQVPLRRDVIFAAVADEEAGGHQGANWLLRNRPDLVDASEILNEGGGGLVFPSGRRIIGINTAERGQFWARVTATGRPSHGSYERPDGATRRLLRALARLEAKPRPYGIVPEVRSLIKTLGPAVGGVGGFVVSNLDFPGLIGLLGPKIEEINPPLATWFGWSINTTVLAAGSRVNVMPGEASAEIDMRLLPDATPADARKFLEDTFQDPGIRIEALSAKGGTRSEAAGPLWDALVAALNAEYPDGQVTKMLAPTGTTDCGLFRSDSTRCYGLWPAVLTFDQFLRVHGNDEFLTVDQLVSGTRVVMRAVEQAAMR